VALRRQQRRDARERLSEVLPVGVEDGQFEGAMRRIAADAAVVAGRRFEAEALGHADRARQIVTGSKLGGEVALAEQRQDRLDGFAGDVVAGTPSPWPATPFSRTQRTTTLSVSSRRCEAWRMGRRRGIFT